MKKTYIVKALNLNDVMVSQRIEAYSADQAKAIVVRKNKYLRIQSAECVTPPSTAVQERLI